MILLIGHLLIKKYLLKLLKSRKIFDISDVKNIGSFVYSDELANGIINETITLETINNLANKMDFDVRTDDLITVYSFKFNNDNYLALVCEPYEFLIDNYLLNVIKYD